MIRIVIYLLCLLFSYTAFSQKVGLVLSGGGAPGFAHIGAIKALEESGIPIDCISGTSAGALIGGMYAAGMSPKEMIEFVSTSQFNRITKGRLEENERFLLQKQVDDASVLELPFSFKSSILKSIPTNLVKPHLIDYTLLELIGTVSQNNHHDFDSLFVPFRCVAADIESNSSVIFSKGNLYTSIRASLTYPFFINPISINNRLLFDGGLYNNFPADIMYQEFDPDYIIGITVTDNAVKPKEDDVTSHIMNMLMNKSDFSIPCESGILIKPKTGKLGTFDFDQIQDAIQAGYDETMKHIEDIKREIQKTRSQQELENKRKLFKQHQIPVVISKVTTNNQERKNFISRSIIFKNDKKPLTLERLKKRYFRLLSMEHINFLYPTLELLPDSTYQLDLHVLKSKPFKLEVGGLLSSRPINTGYVGLNYYYLNRSAWHAKAEGYFGRFYTSGRVAFDYQPPSNHPIVLSPYFIINHFDYFRSSTSFFQNIQPSFLIQDELFGGLKIKTPISNSALIELDVRGVQNNDSYYAIDNFAEGDTADITKFTSFVGGLKIEWNTLNRKQFANQGRLLQLSTKYILGHEMTRPGSTSNELYDQVDMDRNWINLSFHYKDFFINTTVFHFGIDIVGVLNSQSLFSNYKASILAMTAYSPIPDMNTLFMKEFRSPQYLGAGANAIFTPIKSLDIRLEAYYYQPFKMILLHEDNTFNYSQLFQGERFVASTSIIYNSPIGPLRFAANYFHRTATPFSFQFSFGYLLFNERSTR